MITDEGGVETPGREWSKKKKTDREKTGRQGGKRLHTGTRQSRDVFKHVSVCPMRTPTLVPSTCAAERKGQALQQ